MEEVSLYYSVQLHVNLQLQKKFKLKKKKEDTGLNFFKRQTEKHEEYHFKIHQSQAQSVF